MKEEKELPFFKKVITSIKKFEEYPKLASKNWSVVLAYMLKLLAIFAIIATIAFIYTLLSGNTVENSGISANQQAVLINNLKDFIAKNFSSSNETLIYITIFFMAYIYTFSIYFVSILTDVLLLGAFGYFTAIILRIHLKYNAMCKIAVYSLTLPLILNAIYILIRTFTTFQIKYFEAMYIGIAYIYIVTAILMIKSDILKNQQELTKILQEQEKVRQELEKKEEEAKKEEKSKEEEKEKQREKEKKEKDDEQNQKNGEEPQGENA